MLIQVSNLQFAIGKRVILDGISLQLSPGDALWITGANGSGKTMLTRALAGLLPSTNAYIQRSVTLNVGLFLNRPSLYPGLTIAQNLSLFETLWQADATEANRFLQLVDIDPNSKLPVRKLSLGMQQKAGLAVSLVTRPNLLLWDEPFNGIDNKSLQVMIEYLGELRRLHQTAIVLTSHQHSRPILPDMAQMELAEGRMVTPTPV